MKNIAIIAFLGLLLFSSCEQTVFVDGDKFEKRIAVWSEIEQDSLPKIYLTYTRSYYEYFEQAQVLESISDALVTIEGNNFLDTLSVKTQIDSTYTWDWQTGQQTVVYTTRYYYEGHRPMQKDVLYKFKAKKGDKTLSSEMVMNGLTGVALSARDTSYTDEWGGFYEGTMIRFKDAIGTGNYYKISGYYYQWQYEYDNTGQIIDSIRVKQEMYPTLYSDTDLADGAVYEYFLYKPYFYNGAPVVYYVTLQTLTEDLGKYLSSVETQGYSQGDPFQEPTLLKSNIEGGIGAFGGYAVADTLMLRYYP